MRIPIIYTAQCIKNWNISFEVPNGQWIPARPVGYNPLSLFYRIKTAWKVFKGDLDALNWQEKDYKEYNRFSKKDKDALFEEMLYLTKMVNRLSNMDDNEGFGSDMVDLSLEIEEISKDILYKVNKEKI